MAEVTYYKIDGNGKRVQVTEEFEVDSSSVGIQTYVANRTHAPEGDHSKPAYPNISEQLDLLWHDIDAGKFGATAKVFPDPTKLSDVITPL